MDMPFLAYTGSFELAARELARTPLASENYDFGPCGRRGRQRL